MATSSRTTTAGRIPAAIAAGIVIAAGLGAISYAVWQTYRGREAQFTYDLAELRRTDPKLIVCRESAAPLPTGLTHSRAIATGPGNVIYVSGDQVVRRLDTQGRPLGEIGLTGPAGALGIDPCGTVYVAVDREVFSCPPSGRPARWAAAEPNAVLTSIAAGDGDIYVADAGNRVVRRYDRRGKLLREIGRKNPARNTPGFVLPGPYLDVAMAPDGLLRVAISGRHRIEAYTPDGDLESWWGRYSPGPDGFCGCCNPINFALLPGGKAFGRFGGFVTCEKGLARVKIYDDEGRFVGVVAGPESFTKHTELLAGKPAGAALTGLDVAVDARGRILVLDVVVNEVRFFERTATAAREGETKP